MDEEEDRIAYVEDGEAKVTQSEQLHPFHKHLFITYYVSDTVYVHLRDVQID